MKIYILIILTLTLLSCSEDNNVNAESNFETKNIATNLDTPWEILWGPDNHIWMTERYGRISRVNPENGNVQELLTIEEVFEDGERGLMGMVLHPNFDTNPYVYIVYTYNQGQTLIRVVRYTYTNNALESPEIIIDDIKGAWNHDGSRLWIDDDLKLYMTTGDAAEANLSQDTTNLNGNLLRMNLDGSIPDDNPIPGSYIYSFGLRNSQGLVFANGMIYSSDHGPANDDEVNILKPTKNYGWPNVQGFCDTPSEIEFCEENNVEEPIAAWTPTLAVCGLDYYNHNYIPEFNNSLLLVTLKASKMVQLKLNETFDKVTEEKDLFKGDFGRLRDLCISPDGRLFIATSNRDGRGNPAQQDDRIIEIIPITNGAVINKKNEPLIYPNPADESISINIPDNKFTYGSISIYDNFGKLFFKEKIINNNQKFNLNNILSKGMYLVIINYNDNVIRDKIIIK